jgi:hypothetical protein
VKIILYNFLFFKSVLSIELETKRKINQTLYFNYDASKTFLFFLISLHVGPYYIHLKQKYIINSLLSFTYIYYTIIYYINKCKYIRKERRNWEHEWSSYYSLTIKIHEQIDFSGSIFKVFFVYLLLPFGQVNTPETTLINEVAIA